MARDLLKPLILLTNLSEAARITSAVTGGSPCAFQLARRACMTDVERAECSVAQLKLKTDENDGN
jgi:hypothetical protein